MVFGVLFILLIILWFLIMFIKLSFFVSFIIDFVFFASLGGYITYKYIAPIIATSEGFWIIVLIGAGILGFVYCVLFLILIKTLPKVAYIFNFIMSVLGASAFFFGIKTFIEFLYSSLYLNEHHLVHLDLTIYATLNYIVYGIIVLLFGYFIHKTRVDTLELEW